MPPYFEDIEEQHASQKPRGASWPQLAVFVAMIACGAAMVYLQMEQYLCLLVLVSLLVLGIVITWQNRQQSKQAPVVCPQCHAELRADSMAFVVSTRACQRCQYVFPSRLPPLMRRVQLDPKHLPRVWLQGEVPTALVATSEPGPAPQEKNSSNPYAAPPPVTDTAPGRAKVSFLGAWGRLFWWWGDMTVRPLVTLTRTDAQLLSNDNLAVPRQVETERSRQLKQSYVRAVRRQAWAMLLSINLPAAVVAAYFLLGNMQPGEAWWPRIMMAIGMHGVALVVCAIVYSVAAVRAPSAVRRWLAGGLTSIPSETDPETGYFGIRWRTIGMTAQLELPRITFRFRQQVAGAALLRVVNHELAEALELPLPYETPGQWQAVDVDLLLVVRQSAPEFFGDEIHLTGNPAGELEMADYRVIARM